MRSTYVLESDDKIQYEACAQCGCDFFDGAIGANHHAKENNSNLGFGEKAVGELLRWVPELTVVVFAKDGERPAGAVGIGGKFYDVAPEVPVCCEWLSRACGRTAFSIGGATTGRTTGLKATRSTSSGIRSCRSPPRKTSTPPS